MEMIMQKLFNVYNRKCPHAKVDWADYNESTSEGRIALKEGITIVHYLDYKGGEFIRFTFDRLGETYHFMTYEGATKFFNMEEERFQEFSSLFTSKI